MKNILHLTLTSLLLIFVQYAIAQPIHTLSVKSTPVIDGSYHAQEWIGSDSASIDLLNGTSVTVKFKRDDSSFYFLFYGPMGSFAGVYTMYPEVVFDPLYNRGDMWQSDDQWFHVSYTDCSSIGEPDDYANCLVTQTDWFGMPNFSSGFHPDTIEIEIPFAKLQLDITTTDTIGFCLMTNTANGANNFWRIWPLSSDKFIPKTWAKIAIDHTAGINVKDISKEKLDIWFDSQSNQIVVNLKESQNTLVEAQIIDITGRQLLRQNLNQNDANINVTALRTGIYFAVVKTNNNYYVRKILINR